jgi:hypothetical protein
VELKGSSKYARELVERFIRRYIKLSPVLVREHAHKFSRLAVDSRLETALVAKPSGFRHPHLRFVNMNLSEGLCVIMKYK